MSSSGSSCPRCNGSIAVVPDGEWCPDCDWRSPSGYATPPAERQLRLPPVPTTMPLPAAPRGFEMVSRLGGGGMGEVYLVRERATRRLVALKFLRHWHDRTLYERFKSEVELLARLRHRNIVGILSADFDGVPYFTMEVAVGGSLARHVARARPLDPLAAVRIVREVARAAGAAHAAGILHRDIKPSNILLGADGPVVENRATGGFAVPALELGEWIPKLSDFGLAKHLGGGESLTFYPSGGVGTPSYRPPEQFSCDYGEVCPASDVYAIGATLFHLVVGRPPFAGERDPAAAPPRPRALRPSVPPELEAVILKCLEPRRADRYASATELGAELDRVIDGKVPDAARFGRARRAVRRVRRNDRRIAGAVVIVASAVGLVVGGIALGERRAADRSPGDAAPSVAKPRSAPAE